METKNNYIAPLIVLGAEPKENISLKDFFLEENNPFYNLIKNPPYLRYSGWNLLTLDQPRIKDGKCWEVKNGDRKTIRLYRDGSIVAIAYADESFLGWGSNHEDFLKFPQLNTLAVVEYVYEFVNLYKEVLKNINQVNKVQFGIGIKQVDRWEGGKLYLKPKKVLDLWYKSDFDNDSLTPVTKDFYEATETDNKYDPKYISFELISAFFIHFGISPDKIPYTAKDDKGKIYIDIQQIISNK